MVSQWQWLLQQLIKCHDIYHVYIPIVALHVRLCNTIRGSPGGQPLTRCSLRPFRKYDIHIGHVNNKENFKAVHNWKGTHWWLVDSPHRQASNVSSITILWCHI